MSESPAFLAAQVYEREYCNRSFEEDLYLYLANGYVFCTQTAFIMGRPVHSRASYQKVVNPRIAFFNPDTWWIALAAGDGIPLFFKFEPYPLPFFGWEKSNRPRFYPREKVLRHANRNSDPTVRCVPGFQGWGEP